jgi:hypothetical protein
MKDHLKKNMSLFHTEINVKHFLLFLHAQVSTTIYWLKQEKWFKNSAETSVSELAHNIIYILFVVNIPELDMNRISQN